MTETEKQELEPRKPENVYDDWQIEAIERIEGPTISVLSDQVICWGPSGNPFYTDGHTIFEYDGTREGFQAAFKEWSYANEEIEPPF